jgi:hypothetical protein
VRCDAGYAAHALRVRCPQLPRALAVDLTPSGCCSYARDKPRFADNLDVIKFLCKEFWSEVFKKQVDNLKTNYRVRCTPTLACAFYPHAFLSFWCQGVYVLTDTRFRWLSRFAGASGPGASEVVARALHVPCGILAGALAGLGVAAVVTAEPGAPPACAFTVRIKTPPAPTPTPPGSA